MRCPSCHSENPENASFCIECGAAFERRCAKCRFDNPPRAKFCSRCGSSFTEPDIPPISEGSTPNVDQALESRGSRHGERRHLTVLNGSRASSASQPELNFEAADEEREGKRSPRAFADGGRAGRCLDEEAQTDSGRLRTASARTAREILRCASDSAIAAGVAVLPVPAKA
jgi:ribosomal protein L40E